MAEQQIRVTTADGYVLSATVTDGKRNDLIVWAHGISVDKDEHLGFFRDGANALAREGYGSIRFDFRGHGQSSGSSLDFSVVGQSVDLEAIVRLATDPRRPLPARLHLVAASFGAPPALFAAGRHPEAVSTVCLISPVLSYRRTFLEPETEWGLQLFGEEELGTMEKTGRLALDSRFYVSRRLFEEMRIIRPDVALRELRQPVLVFHGDCDTMVPYDATVEACRGCNHVNLVTMDGTDHGFMVVGDDNGTDAQSVANKDAIYRRILEQIRRPRP